MKKKRKRKKTNHLDATEFYYVLMISKRNSNILDLVDLRLKKEYYSLREDLFNKKKNIIEIDKNTSYISVSYYVLRNEVLSEDKKKEMRLLLYELTYEYYDNELKNVASKKDKLQELFKKDLREKKINKLIGEL